MGNPPTLERVASRLTDMPADHPVRLLVPADAVLVPAPRSTPLAKGALWPAKAIAEAMVAAGVGQRVAPLLTRSMPVRRSTGASTAAGREPPLRHHETLAAPGDMFLLGEAEHLVLVDDVVTTGSTLIACASRLAEVAPSARIAAFSVARAERHVTLSQTPQMYSPVVEVITLANDEARPWRGN